MRGGNATLKISPLMRREMWAILVATGIWYLLVYVLYVAFHTAKGFGPGAPAWMGWFDQGEYYAGARAIVAGHPSESHYWLGYPLLGAPFVRWLPFHPFLFANMAAALVVAGSFYAACRRFVGTIEAVLLLAVLVCANSLFWKYSLVIPWNNIPAVAVLFGGVAFLLLRRATPRACAIYAVAVGIAVFARPPEVLACGLLFLFALPDLPGWRERAFAVTLFAGACLVAAAVTVGINLHAFHSISSPYMVGEHGKFSVLHLPLKIYQFFCDGGIFFHGQVLPLGSHPRQILESWPWLIPFLAPGVLFLWRRLGPKAAAGLLAVLVVEMGFYLCYVPVNNPPHFWSFKLYHYVWWVTPWLGLVAYLGIRRAPWMLPKPVFVAAVTVPVALFAVVGWGTWEVASDGDGLEWSEAADDGGTHIEIVARRPIRAVDLRLKLRREETLIPLTQVSEWKRIAVSVDGKGLAPMADFMPSEGEGRIDFSFLDRGLSLEPGEAVRIVLRGEAAPIVGAVTCLGTRFEPGAGPRHLAIEWFQRPSFPSSWITWSKVRQP
jgi:hypothetical protein